MSRAGMLVCTLVVTSALLAHAADDPLRTPSRWTMLPEQWKPIAPDSPALHLPDRITRDEQIERVTLKDAIALALQNNPGVAAQRLEPFRQEGGVLQLQGVLDPTLSGEVQSVQSTTPNASSLAGNRTLNIDDRTANLHLFKTFRTGTLATVDFLNERLDNNATFNQLRPEYIPQLRLSIAQPLLQNFGWDFTYLVVRVQEQVAESAFFTYQAQLANFVEQVVEAYWNVVRAREDVEVQRESKALADRTTQENEARVKVGLLPPVAVLEAQADAASREEQVIIAENALAVARQQLAQIAFYRPDDTFVPRTLEPTDPATAEDVHADVDDTLQTALAARPEIAASARNVKAQVLGERIAGNALLPRLDLVGSYGVNGLAGSNHPVPRPVQTTFTSPIDLSAGLPTGLPGTRCTPSGALFLCTRSVEITPTPSPFVGSRGEAYERLGSGDFRSYSFGVQFQVPFSNATARGAYAQSRIARSQSELSHRDLLSQVTLEVRQAVANLTSARQRIDTTRVARELAEENLRNQTKRHEVGMATTKDLLDFQTRLTTARGAEVAAQTDYAIAVAQWRRAEGKLLDHYQVVFDGPGSRSTPWFARF